jgi:fructose-bisphosphate aldolase class I
VASSAEHRHAYHELLFSTPGLEAFISGVLLEDAMLRGQAPEGIPLPEWLRQRGIILGVTVDQGPVALPGFPGETITEGLDALRERLADCCAFGARFTAWRAELAVADEAVPSACWQHATAHAIARYAALSQEAGLVPVVQLKVCMETDSLVRGAAVTSETLQSVFTELHAHRIRLDSLLLYAEMVGAGPSGPLRMRVEPMANAMVSWFRRVVPAAVPGIVFMPGSLNLPLATLGKQPWRFIPAYSPQALWQHMGVLTPEAEQAAWRAVCAWMSDPQTMKPPLQAVETLVLETLAPTTWPHNADPSARAASRELRELISGRQRDVTRVLGTTLGEWQRHHGIAARPQGIPLDSLLAYAKAGGPVHACGRVMACPRVPGHHRSGTCRSGIACPPKLPRGVSSWETRH